ncbi:helix-turn-helix domain-containing protein [Streptomyces sp. NPDC056486]|uniref:helix-turn-helix domain-containing protein n=1 Tax=Streptomyces sp. NPDC056486 TaxID=3345835 RepID=UPI0036CA9D7B
MSAAWQPLPEALPPEVRHFVEQLRLLKDRTGLSLIALGKETAYSKSSWQRYLNAQQPPPRQAVAALCRVAGADGERFGARWELAVRVWPRRAAAEEVAVVRGEEAPPWWELPVRQPQPQPQPQPQSQPRSWRPPLRRPAALSWRLVACSALAVVVFLLAVLLWDLAR